MLGVFTACGQMCVGAERIYVRDEVYDEFVRRVRGKVEGQIHFASNEVTIGKSGEVKADVTRGSPNKPMALSSLLGSLCSMFFALIGGLICAGRIWIWW